MIQTREEATKLIIKLGAQPRLLRHLSLVIEVCDELTVFLMEMGVNFDQELTCIGAAIHDAGKIIHAEELNEAGNNHELAGEQLLLSNGVPPKIARFCLSHSRYAEMEVSFEELLVALADKLWKGKREGDLELIIIDSVAEKLQRERWDVYYLMDNFFEQVASTSDSRLVRSTEM